MKNKFDFLFLSKEALIASISLEQFSRAKTIEFSQLENNRFMIILLFSAMIYIMRRQVSTEKNF